MYRILFASLAKAVVEQCAQTAEATEGIAHDVLVDGKTETVTCGCGNGSPRTSALLVKDPVKSMRALKTSAHAWIPRSTSELREWVHARLHLRHADELVLLDACEAVVARQRDTLKESKEKAIRTLSDSLTVELAHLQHELSAKDETVKDIARYFEGVLADLREQAHRDPKTTLLHFNRFMERLECFLGFEQRLRWCAVGLVDITTFKWYNDTVGHLVGDRIIERVAHILTEQIRSDDLLAGEPQSTGRRHKDLHARFGGDEFCFLIPGVPGFAEACTIAQRFKTAVERYNWAAEHPALAERPVLVDVGMVCLQLGPRAERQPRARKLAAELIQRADELMYCAKSERGTRVRSIRVRLDDGGLIELGGSENVRSHARTARTTGRTAHGEIAAAP